MLYILTDNKDAQLIRGQSAVVSLLGKLPSTQHSPESFVVDVAISVVITCHCSILSSSVNSVTQILKCNYTVIITIAVVVVVQNVLLRVTLL